MAVLYVDSMAASTDPAPEVLPLDIQLCQPDPSTSVIRPTEMSPDGIENPPADDVVADCAQADAGVAVAMSPKIENSFLNRTLPPLI
jgi:hypothetical protein